MAIFAIRVTGVTNPKLLSTFRAIVDRQGLGGVTMAYNGGGSSGFKSAAGLALAVVVAVTVGALVRGGTREAITYANTSPAAIEAELQSKIDENPSFKKMYSAMKESYPEKYQEFMSGLSENARSGGDANSYAFNFMRSFTLSLRDDFKTAPPADIQLVLDKHVELMDVLANESEFNCGQFAFEGLREGTKLSPNAMSVMADANALQITAAAAGRDGPVVHQPPSAADWAEVSDKMLDLGTTEAELQLVSNGPVSAMSESRKCKVGRDLYTAIVALPPEAAARIGASLLIPE